MADYTESKDVLGAVYPENMTDTPWGRLEPLIKPSQLKSRHLFGIPLVSKYKDEDGKPFKMTPEMLEDYINLAVNEAELETGMTIMPSKFHEKLPYRREDYHEFGYMNVKHHPVHSIQKLVVELADGSEVFLVPLEWVEVANLPKGQINIIPMAFNTLIAGSGSIIGGGLSSASGTAAFFTNLINRHWLAALWGVQYTAGFPDGLVPTVVNELIGVIAAMKVLSLLGATRTQSTSASLGVDQLSQSSNTPGGDAFRIRMEELGNQRKMLIGKLKKKFVLGDV